jgi:hypothetical protein
VAAVDDPVSDDAAVHPAALKHESCTACATRAPAPYRRRPPQGQLAARDGDSEPHLRHVPCQHPM